MIALLAIALAAAAPSLSKAYVVDVCLERNHPRACIRAERNRLRIERAAEQAEFLCDDHPWRSRGCGLAPTERRLTRFFMQQGGYSRSSAEEVASWHGARLRDQVRAVRLCGPEDVAEIGTVRGRPRCNRYGWNGRRYVDGKRP